MKRLPLFASLAVLLPAGLASLGAHEFGTKTWDFTYDSGNGSDIGDSIRIDSQGRIAVAGWIPTTGDLQDALAFQVTPGGSEVNWDVKRNISGSLRDRFYSMAIDSMDNIICTGVTAKGSNPYSQPLTEKFLADGTSDWQEVWHPSAVGGTEAFSNGVAIDADDKIYTSTYYDIGSHNYILWGVRKYVNTGPGSYNATLEPAYSYDRGSATGSYSYSNRIEGIALDDEGGVCTVGRIGDPANQTRIWHVRRYGLNDAEPPVPELKWSHTYPAEGGGLNGFARRVAIDPDGSPVVVGAIIRTAGVWTAKIVKYNQAPDPESEPANPTGEPAWTIEKETAKSSFYNAVYIDRMGYYWASGYYTDADDSFHGMLVRLDPDDGTILNELTWDEAHPRAFDIRDRRLAVALASEGDIVVELYTPDPPEITLKGDAMVSLEVHSDYTEPGFSAYDVFEREDLTPSVVVTDLPDIHAVGTYTVRYNVAAHNGDAAEERTRTVRVVDTTAPVIALLGGGEIRVDAGVPFVDPGFEVTDNYDDDLAGAVQVSGALDTLVPGVYELRYDVADASGNPAAQVTRRIRVVELRIDSVDVDDTGHIHIACQTQAGASYRVLGSTDLRGWQELALVATPEGRLEWSTLVASGFNFFKVERLIAIE